MRLSLLLGLTLILATGCGSEQQSRADEGPPPELEPLRVTGPIPGPRVDGRFFDEAGRPVSDVHELAAVGEGRRRAALLFGQRNGVPCIGATARDAEPRLDCLERWENPPFLARVVIGGDIRARTDWLVVVGVLRRPATTVSMELQSSLEPRRLGLQSWPKFAWRSFGVMSEHGNLANTLLATDEAGKPVTAIDLGWVYHAARSTGPWAEVRDPIAAASGADTTSHRIVFDHPAVRRLVAGNTFTINPTAGWVACDGRSLGGVVSFRFSPPVEYEGEIPIHEYADEDEDFAYRDGRAYVEAEDVTTVEAWVDVNRRRVVGIELDAFDDVASTLGQEDMPAAQIRRHDVIDEPKPAGGPDDADACPKHEFGD
jgi:hypothetical protein